jgi:hypothetical protein
MINGVATRRTQDQPQAIAEMKGMGDREARILMMNCGDHSCQPPPPRVRPAQYASSCVKVQVLGAGVRCQLRQVTLSRTVPLPRFDLARRGFPAWAVV